MGVGHPGRFGAYGLVLAAPPAGPAWWNRAPSSWAAWTVDWRPPSASDASDASGELLGPHEAWVRTQPSGHAHVRRAESATTLVMSSRPPDEALVHPYCVSTAVINAFWRGWEAFHAGAMVYADAVWCLLGDRGSGKSSTLMWAHQHGLDVISDDLVVVRGGTVLAGPRALDLRSDAVGRFGIGRDIGVIGSRRRWRVPLAPVRAEVALGGWVLLGWGNGPATVRPATGAERLEALLAARALRAVPTDSLGWLDLLAFPAYVLERPRRWSSLDASMEALLSRLR